jgi:Tfp pilus assembly protein PilF
MKKILVILTLAAAGTAAAAWWLRPQAPEWTTDSPQALEEFRAGRTAARQLYHNDALAHYQRALELDPDFLLAKLMVVQVNGVAGGMVEAERIAVLVEDLKAADLTTLTPRESMLVRFFRARLAREPEAAQEVLRDYLAEHPDDPHAVQLSCGQAMAGGRTREAEECYERLIALDPNWVEAQNLLGYLAMARGDFADAEEQFQKYRYIAPDQANPHDSLGELYALTGRYDEAGAEFEAAVAAKRDFCASWGNLVLVALLEHDWDLAEERLVEARRAEGCPEGDLRALECRTAVWKLAVEERWAEVVERAAPCPEAGDLMVLTYWGAFEAGRDDVAAGVEAKVAALREEVGVRDPGLVAVDEHLAGVRLLHERDAGGAVERFRAADAALEFQSRQWIFKLFNRRALVRALEAAGQATEAAALRRELAAVNPHFATPDDHPLPGRTREAAPAR